LSGGAPDQAIDGGAFYRLLRRAIDIRPAEVPVVGWCWLYIFSVLSAYYIIRLVNG
jgi:ATP:ADP antiporter, AAA family